MIDRQDVTALILAAGEGSRFGQPKAYLERGGRTLLEVVAATMSKHCAQIIAGVPEKSLPHAQAILAGLGTAVAGGTTRAATINRVATLATTEWVIIHDVARPDLTPGILDTVLSKSRDIVCPVVRHEVRDSLALMEADRLTGPVARDHLVSLQTPLVFRRTVLLDILERAAMAGIVDSSPVILALELGFAVTPVSTPPLAKITYPTDWPN